MIKPFTDAMRDSIIQMLNYSLFFYKNKVYKNIEAQNC